MTLIAARYAHALLASANEQNNLEKVSADLLTLKEIEDHFIEFKCFLNHPFLSQSEAYIIIQDIANQLNFQTLTVHFLMLLIQMKRQEYLGSIVKNFKDLVEEQSQICHIHLFSSRPLSDTHYQLLKEKLALKSHKKIVLHEKIDPNLIAGIVIEMGHYRIDSTINSQLHQLEKALKE